MSNFTNFWKNSITIGKGNVENGVRGLAQSAKESGKTKEEIKNHLKFAMHGKDVDVDKIVDSVFGKSEDTNKSTNPSVKDLNGSYQIVEDDILDLIYDGEINEAIYKIMDRYNTSPSEAQKVVRQYK